MDLNFKSFGQGEPIIILHGLLGTLDNWQWIAKQLAEDYLVFIVDQRNHGKSPHVEGLSYPLLAEDLAEFMEQNWIHQAHILGHSMGGKTAMQFSLEYPDMVNKLLVADIAPKAYVGGHKSIFDALFSLDLNTLETRKEADQFLEKQIADFGVRQFLLKNLKRSKETGKFVWKMNLAEIWKQYPEILKAIHSDTPFDQETLFLRGGNSNYIADSDLGEIQVLFPKAILKTIEGTGHWLHAEKPQEFLSISRAFFSE